MKFRVEFFFSDCSDFLFAEFLQVNMRRKDARKQSLCDSEDLKQFVRYCEQINILTRRCIYI